MVKMEVDLTHGGASEPTSAAKASDGVISSPKKLQAYDIDALDAHSELAVVGYVEDIYKLYKSTEVKDLFCISDNSFSRVQVLSTGKPY